MTAPRGGLVVIEPSLLELATRYVQSPRKRDSISLELANRTLFEPEGSQQLAQIATGISARFDEVVRAHERARQSADPFLAGEYAQTLFREIAWLAASTGAVYEQGLGRWLGLLASPERFTLVDPPRSVRHLVRAIHHLLQSAASLVPDLALPGFHAALPRSGGPGYASGIIHGEFMGWMEALLCGDPWPLKQLAVEYFGAESAEEWRDTVRRAVRAALRRGGHLLELDASVLRARVAPDRAPVSDIRELRPPAHRARVA